MKVALTSSHTQLILVLTNAFKNRSEPLREIDLVHTHTQYSMFDLNGNIAMHAPYRDCSQSLSSVPEHL